MEKNEKNKSQKKSKSKTKGIVYKKRIIVAGVCVSVVTVIVAVLGIKVKSQAAMEIVYKETTAKKGNLTVGITESGSTVLGSQTIEYSIVSSNANSSNQSTGMGGTNTGTSTGSTSSSSTIPSLEVEELYVVPSDSVEVGDAILKVTDTSYSAVKTYLENAVVSANLQLQQAEINRTLTKTTADNEYKMNSSRAELAQEAYDNTIAKLESAVTSAESALVTAKESIADYNNAIANNTYYKEYKIEELKANMVSKQELVDTVTATKNQLEENIVADSSSNTELEACKSQLQQAQQELVSAQQTYDQAYDKYESSVTQAKMELEILQSQLSNLQLSYNEAITNQKKGKLEAQATLDAANVSANNASTLYQIDLNGIDDEVNSMAEALETAKEQLEAFHTLVVDGKVLANCAGLVTSIGYAVGDSISSATSIATIADATEVTITVSVDQEDIASIAINDQVNVTLTAYSSITYPGMVSSISTTPSNDNSSTVTYPVVVTLTGDVSTIYAGMSADVTFITKEMKDVLYLSNKTINNEGTMSYVKVKGLDGTITNVEVTTGFSDGNNVEILSGVEEGDTVLVESQVMSN